VTEDGTTPVGRGRFITIEGPDGSGKTVQAARLHAVAVACGVPTLLTREPGGTWAGERIREILLGAATTNEHLLPRADALLFSAARAQLVAEVLRPALERGELVVDARHADSTLAYQGFGRGLDVEELRIIQRFATGGLVPDLTILLDLPVEVGLARKAVADENRFEVGFELDFHQRVRDGYRSLAAREPERWVVVDADRDADAVHRSVVEAVARLEPRLRA
jgi:dTMP kinase